MNEWMMHLYSTFIVYCCTPKALYNHVGGGSPQPPPVCSIHLDNAMAATGQLRQSAHHTPATGGEERESLSQSSGWDYWEAMIDKGQWREFGQDTGVTPLLFTRSAMGFLTTTESQDPGLTSHPKDGAFLQ